MTPSLRSLGRAATLALLACHAVACQKERAVERGAPPPPIESSKPGACASGGGTVKDSVSAPFFPRTGGDYCVDPNSEARAFGENAQNSLDAVCTELFDGECKVY